MKALGIICLIVIAIFLIIWLYRRILTAKKYTKTTGEIISVKNIVSLVDKKQVIVKGKYIYTLCKYQGDVYVTVKFINKGGEELTRRYNSSEPLFLKIDEHKRIATQYTSVFPEWRIGKKVKIFYNPKDTLDIFVGKAPPYNKIKAQGQQNQSSVFI